MATAAEIQGALDAAGTKMTANIQQEAYVNGTVTDFYVQGMTSGIPGNAKWVRTTTANTTATQASTILTGLATP